MTPKALVLALAALPQLALAAEPAPLPTAPELAKQWADMVVYSVTPYCQVMANGARVCQPIGMVGPAPSPDRPGLPQLTPVPLAPPTVQMPFGMPTPYMGNPYLPNPYMASPYAGQPGFPFPAMPQFVPTPAQPQQYVPSQATPFQMPAFPTPVPPPAASPAPAAVPAEPMAAQPAPPALPAPAMAAVPAAPAETPSQAAPAPVQESIVVHFAFDSAELDASGRLVLDAWVLQADKTQAIRITGHADRLGPEPYNVILSRRRAEVVKQYLTDKGMKADNLDVQARGEAAPVVRCKGGPTPATKECLAPNRRVEIDPR